MVGCERLKSREKVEWACRMLGKGKTTTRMYPNCAVEEASCERDLLAGTRIEI
jgi:hypothetical protein